MSPGDVRIRSKASMCARTSLLPAAAISHDNSIKLVRYSDVTGVIRDAGETMREPAASAEHRGAYHW
jgi:hypothetical protein